MALHKMIVETPSTCIPTHLKTARLSLEPPTKADDVAQQTMLNDPVAMAHLRFMSKEEKGGWTLADVTDRRQGQLKATEERTGAAFLIHLKSTGEIIGSVGSPVIRFENRSGHVGVMLKKEYWSGGYGTEVLCGYMGMLFEDLKLHKVTKKRRKTKKRRVIILVWLVLTSGACAHTHTNIHKCLDGACVQKIIIIQQQ